MKPLFQHWVLLGSLPALLTAGGVLAREAHTFTPSQRGHWAWKKPVTPPLPRVRRQAWVLNPIDAFVLFRLEERGLQPAPAASREVLIRRVALDLTGLPPTVAEIDAFLADAAPGAYERMVDRYLASPHYGERWARHWLDLARYADTNGYEHDEIRPDAWRYRDYVVRSFNEDKPYNRFVQEQIAGDELDPENPDCLIATGFNLLGPDMTDAADQAARRQNTLNDMTDTAGLVFLGLTMGCARCHDHKYEPLLLKDYYQLQAFFTPARFRIDLPAGTPEEEKAYRRRLAEHERKVEEVRGRMEAVAGPVLRELRKKALAGLLEDVRTAFATPETARTPAQQKLVENHSRRIEPPAKEVLSRLAGERQDRFEKLAAELKTLNDRKPAPPRAMGLWEDGKVTPTYVLERGELENRGPEVRPGYPVILASQGVPPAAAEAVPMQSSGRRLALARWITHPDNPLAARVIVNRAWQHHFGRGLVPTPSDFGLRGENPTHPELLDFLASVFSSTGTVTEMQGDKGAGSKGERRPVAPHGYGLTEGKGAKAQGAGEKRTPVTAAASALRGSPYAIRNTQYASNVAPTAPQPRTPGPAEGLGWSIKKLHRLILTSNAYKQSSRPSARTLATDPENEVFSRMNRVRLEAEAIRDATLLVSGRLNPRMGGPGVFPPVPRDPSTKGAEWPVSRNPADHTRRSLYVFVRRNLPFPAFEVLDTPDTNQSCPVRETSTTAPQALSLLNDSEMLLTAQHFAGRLLREAPDTASRITLAYRLALARRPTARELTTGEEFLKAQAELIGERPRQELALPVPCPEDLPSAQGAALTDYCLALLNLNEFVYVD